MQNRTTRFVTLISLVLLLLTAGCEGRGHTPDGAPSSAPAAKLIFWTPFTGGDGSFMRDLVNEYNRTNPDHVSVELINNNSDEYYTRLPTAIVTNEAPDVAIVHASRFRQFANAGFLTNIQDEAEAAGVRWENYNSKILSRTMINDDHYAIPLDTHFDVMYYNKKWIASAGLLNDDGSLKLQSGEDGFSDFLTTLREKLPPEVAPLALPDARSDAYWLWWSFYNQMDGGGTFYSNDGQSLAIDNKRALKALRYVDSLYESKFIPPNLSDTLTLFSQNKAALLILGVWSSGALANESSIDIGVAPIPLLYDHPATWGDSHTLAFPVHDKSDPDKLIASVKFADWITQHGDSWAKAGHVPGNLQALRSEGYRELRFSSEFSKEVDHVAYFPDHPFQGEINDSFSAYFTKMLHGALTPELLLQEAQKQITEQIQDLFGDGEP